MSSSSPVGREPSEKSPIVHMWEPGALRKLVRTYLLERTLWRLPRDGSVLDLCCGYGFYFSINPLAAGVDGDRRAVELLSRRGYDVKLANVLDGLPYDNARFSWVIAHDVLEHFDLPELERLIPEVLRILAPSGHFLVIVPNRRGYGYGVRAGVGHKLFVTGHEVRHLTGGTFELEANYPEPLPRWIGRFFTHNKEVFRLRKL